MDPSLVDILLDLVNTLLPQFSGLVHKLERMKWTLPLLILYWILSILCSLSLVD